MVRPWINQLKICLAGYNEKRLLHDLLDTYNTLERPVLNESDPLQLSFGLTLMQIIDVNINKENFILKLAFILLNQEMEIKFLLRITVM
uniref:Neurotransmitter-gated ion-channel ligand-binding domain-containing protein n=1 Tax=Glossina palpalis gambiensis TaxID=67801 RepID=A0A1B0B0P0_9MUSC